MKREEILRKFTWVLRKFMQFLFIASFVFLLLLFTFPIFVYYNYRRFVYVDTESVELTDIAIVFGASAYSLEEASPPLQERLETAAKIYKGGKIKKIIVSGNKESPFYNEPLTMVNTLVKLGVDGNDIVEDFAGYRTYDTCVRAKKVFGVNKALLISQGYHLPRAIFICKSVGIDATGVYSSGDFSTYYNRWYSIREILAIYNAFVDIYITPPPVVIESPQPITID